MSRGNETDFLRWILGGFLIVGGTIPTVATTAPTNTPVANAAALPNHAAVIAQVPTTVPTTPTPLAVQPTSRPALPPGQVWECVVNGQRTFSDVRCGDHAAIRQLSETNRMEATPVLPVWVYPPPDAGYPRAPAEQNTPESDNDVYASEQVYLINERIRREHSARHHHHEHGPARKN